MSVAPEANNTTAPPAPVEAPVAAPVDAVAVETPAAVEAVADVPAESTTVTTEGEKAVEVAPITEAAA